MSRASEASKIITFINEKGGVGKTSVCFNIAWELSCRSKKILMIDMDGQKANLTFFAGVNTGAYTGGSGTRVSNNDQSDGRNDDRNDEQVNGRSHNENNSHDKPQEVLTMSDVFKREVDIKSTIMPVKENLDIVPADSGVANLDMSAKVSKFRKAVESIQELYDYVFIDVNPAPGWSHYLSLSICDYAVIVMLPDIASLEGNKGILETVEEIQETNNERLEILGIVLNKNNDRTVLARQVSTVATKMAEQHRTKIFATKIRNSVVMSENIISHKGVTDYASSSAVAEDIRRLADEFVSTIEQRQGE